ncbi:hypothetical protein LINGRAHAP2_LOCUS19983 [Linum grandiflorum]
MDPIPSSIITTSYVVQFSQDDVGDDRIRLDLSLIGRIFWPADPKPAMSVLHALARQWRIPPEDLQIFDVGHCLTQFVFPTIKDKERIFQSQPWAFKSSIINLMEWETPSQMVFDRLQYMPLVIQMKEIPYPYSTVKFCSKLVEPLGTVLSADMFSKYPDGHGSRFIKCTVRINLLQSLAGRIQAVVPNQQPFWVLLRYEDLPTVCFICGMLGHGYKHCAYAEVLPFNREERGDWMLARPEGHKIKTPNFSETATSKQKRRSQKPVPSFFHTYVQASPETSSNAMQIGNLPISAPPLRTISEGPICDELQEMDIEDRKRPRDLTLEPDYGSSKKLKIADIPLLESDFPEGVLDLEPLSSDDIDEFAAELAAELEPVSTEVNPGVIPHPIPTPTVSMSTEEVKVARPKRPRKPK